MSVYRWQNQTLIIHLSIVPNAKIDEVIGAFDNAIKIKIKAPARDNKANEYLMKLLSQWFKAPKSNIKVLKGSTSRDKTISIENPGKLPEWLST